MQDIDELKDNTQQFVLSFHNGLSILRSIACMSLEL